MLWNCNGHHKSGANTGFIATVGAAFVGVLVLAIAMAVLKNAYTKWKEQNLWSEDRSFTDRVFHVFYLLQL